MNIEVVLMVISFLTWVSVLAVLFWLKQVKNEEKSRMVGKKVIVRANVPGVHAGIVESFSPSKSTVTLSNARRLWRYYTRDKSGSVSDIAANGLIPTAENAIGATLKSVTIVNPQGLELAEMTDEAYCSIMSWEVK